MALHGCPFASCHRSTRTKRFPEIVDCIKLPEHVSTCRFSWRFELMHQLQAGSSWLKPPSTRSEQLPEQDTIQEVVYCIWVEPQPWCKNRKKSATFMLLRISTLRFGALRRLSLFHWRAKQLAPSLSMPTGARSGQRTRIKRSVQNSDILLNYDE